MGIRFRRQRSEDPSALLTRAQDGDEEARNQLIADYTPFVLKVASQKAGRFLRPGMDEEISVALFAFNEAISAYDAGRGSFLAFSQTVIQRRLVDHFRRNKGRYHEVLLSEFDNEDEEAHEPNPLDRMAQSAWGLVEEQELRRLEIVEYTEILKKYEIGFQELVRVAPKHRDARDRAIGVARAVAGQDAYRQVLLERGELPIKWLVGECGISRKLLERNRKYIIAVALIFLYDLPHLKAYVLER